MTVLNRQQFKHFFPELNRNDIRDGEQVTFVKLSQTNLFFNAISIQNRGDYDSPQHF